METNTDWTVSSSDHVTFGYESSGCFNSVCTRTTGSSGTDAYVRKSTDISAYSSLQLQFSVSCTDLEAGDTCKVYYAYDSISSRTMLSTMDPPDDEARHFYENQIVSLPSSESKSTVYIWLEADTADTSGSDYCYWNNVYLNGVLSEGTTLRPTPQPTSQPTPQPTQHPTPQPTVNPALHPTAGPTNPPTYTPHNNPSSSPTPPPTDYTSSSPTNDPIEPPIAPPTGPPIKASTEEAEGSEDHIVPNSVEDTDIWTKLRDQLLVIFIVLSFGLFLCCVILLLIIRIKIYTKNKKHKEAVIIIAAGDTVNSSAEGPGHKQRKETATSETNDQAMILAVRMTQQQDHIVDDCGSDNEPGRMKDVAYVGGSTLEQAAICTSLPVIPGEFDGGEDDPDVDEGPKYGVCTDCDEYKIGQLYDGDDLFYCVECWRKYEDVIEMQQHAIVGGNTIQ